MGYYHIKLNPDAKKLCTIVLPWGKNKCQRLPMGLCNSQGKMGGLSDDLEYVRAYIDDLLVFSNHFGQIISRNWSRLKKVEICWIEGQFQKVLLWWEELEYWITRKGIQPILKKVQAILAMQPPKDKRHLRRFIGMKNFYRDLWICRSEILDPLTELTSKTTKWQWTDRQESISNH